MKTKDHSGAKLISLERTRQQKQEGYHISHDDGHDQGELGRAAICYVASALKITVVEHVGNGRTRDVWPGNDWDFNPKDPMRDLVRAGALIAAEIDRLRRLAKEDANA